MAEHLISLRVTDDLRRSRLTVLFRLLLVLPHLVWLALWSLAAIVAAVLNWVATLVTGQPPLALYRFLGAYVRYMTHVSAYLSLAANPFPGFTGRPGSYPVDVEIGPPERQSRWATGFRLVLAVPALLLAAALIGSFGGGGYGGGSKDVYYTGSFAGVVWTVAFLAWFACLVTGRMPPGFRNLLAYALRYVAQVDGYLFLLTGRYPNSDPAEPAAGGPAHPIRLTVRDDRGRSRLTVFFRLLLALPHLVWLLLWTVAAFLAAVLNWFATLFAGRSPRALYRFLSAYVRYGYHLQAYLTLVANPFPGFTGTPGSYPVDLEIGPPERQSRWVTGFRLVLAVPAFLVSSALDLLVFLVAFLGWFASLVTGRMPEGLRNVGAYAIRYGGQLSGYLFLLTDRYPFSGPSFAGAREPRQAPAPA